MSAPPEPSSGAPPVAARALSFDLDGTLYRVRRARVAWRLRRSRPLLDAMLAAREQLRGEPPCAGLDALILREAELVAPRLRWTVDEARQRLVELHAAMPYALTRGARAFAGVAAALGAAARAGLRLAVLSDYDAEAKLADLGLAELPWAAVVGAENLGALKPHRAGFVAVAARLEVPIEALVHVGDREDLDVRGALEAGARAWRFDPRGRGEPSRAERVFDRWTAATFEPLWAAHA
jgi:FMN phosphatase YigB (HAD superfamily)